MRLIDADAVLDFLQIIPIDLGYREIEDVENFVKELPTIEERKTGRWSDYPIAEGCIQCSICGVLRMGEPSNYCPNCGAKMGVEHETD